MTGDGEEQWTLICQRPKGFGEGTNSKNCSSIIRSVGQNSGNIDLGWQEDRGGEEDEKVVFSG